MSLPTSKTTFTSKTNGDVIDASHINTIQTSITGIEDTVGITGSADTSSLKYKVENTSSLNPGHKHSLSSLSDFNVTSPTSNQTMLYNSTSGKWENGNTTIADASTTVKGATKLSVAPVSGTNPIAVGDNDTRVADTSYSNKGIVQLNTDASTSGLTVASGVVSVNTGTSANQIVKLGSDSKLPAVDGSNLTNVLNGDTYISNEVIANGSTGSTFTRTIPATATKVIINHIVTNYSNYVTQQQVTLYKTGLTSYGMVNANYATSSYSVSGSTITISTSTGSLYNIITAYYFK